MALAEVKEKGKVNERVRFFRMSDERVFYMFPKVSKWVETSEFTIDVTPQLEVYPDGKQEFVGKLAITAEDLEAALTHWAETMTGGESDVTS